MSQYDNYEKFSFQYLRANKCDGKSKFSEILRLFASFVQLLSNIKSLKVIISRIIIYYNKVEKFESYQIFLDIFINVFL